MSLRERLEETARAVGCSWGDVQSMTFAEFARRVAAVRRDQRRNDDADLGAVAMGGGA